MTDDELAHYGIKGMKWGVRRGSLGSRLTGSLADANQRQTAVLRRARENRGVGVGEKTGRAIGVALRGGTKRYNKAADENLKLLGDQRKRIESGKLKVNDILQIIGNIGMGDLVVSVRDNKG